MVGERQRVLEVARTAAANAAVTIRRFYKAAGPVGLKTDGSPVTPADRAAHDVIAAALAAATPDIPIASEEGGDIEADRYWSVDPLDGTKEYVARTGAFVVSIALIESMRPVVGVIHVPVTDTSYFAAQGAGAFRCDDGVVQRITTACYHGGRIRLIGSARHGVEAVTVLCRALAGPGQPIEHTALGSAWKFAKLAEGQADLYPRIGPTHTWDTAAGQCLIEEAGGVVWVIGRQPLLYRHPRQLNPSFVAIGDPRYPWPDLLA